MGLFKKLRKTRIQNRLKTLRDKKIDLEGEGYGVFLPEGREGKKLRYVVKRINKLEDRLKKLNLGGPMYDMRKDKMARIPGMWKNIDDRKGII